MLEHLWRSPAPGPTYVPDGRTRRVRLPDQDPSGSDESQDALAKAGDRDIEGRDRDLAADVRDREAEQLEMRFLDVRRVAPEPLVDVLLHRVPHRFVHEQGRNEDQEQDPEDDPEKLKGVLGEVKAGVTDFSDQGGVLPGPGRRSWSRVSRSRHGRSHGTPFRGLRGAIHVPERRSVITSCP